MSRNVARLPPELTDAIIDLLHTDRRALEACSLVCKSWAPKSRYHFFRRVKLSVKHFSNFIQSRSTAIPLFRHLELHNPQTSEIWNDVFGSLPRFGFETIETLTILCLPWRYMAPKAQSKLVRCFAAITELHLHAAWVNSFSDLVHLMCAFSQLEKLILAGIACPDISIPSTSETPRLPRNLHTLKITDCNNELVLVLLQWLSSFESALRVFHLGKVSFPWELSQSLNSFLESLGPRLEELHWESNSCRVPSVSLAHNVGLRSIHIYLSPHYDLQTRWLTETLLQINTPRFEEVVFRGASGMSLHSVDWKQVDKILALPALSNLRRVTIHPTLSIESTKAAWRLFFLPQCDARGILVFGTIECNVLQ